MTTTIRTAMYLILTSAAALVSTQVQAQNNNTKFGVNALGSPNLIGSFNAAFGDNALGSHTSGGHNTASGSYSLFFNNTGSFNTATGYDSLYFNTSGSYNTASGSYSLYLNNTGNYNTANGYGSLFSNTTGNNNTASGASSLYSNTAGERNTASGNFSLLNNTTGFYNTAQGESSLYNNTTGSGNVAIGQGALYSNTTGAHNIALGQLAGYVNQTGSNNVFIGRTAGFFESGSNKLWIASHPSSVLLYGEFSNVAAQRKLGIGTFTVPVSQAIAVWNGAHLTTGGVWNNASLRELKENIETLSTEDANATLEGLSPVRYVYSNSPDEAYVGFIAEDVPELVASNDRKSLSPMDIVAVLTTVMKEQKAEIAEHKAEIAALRDALANQESTIQQQVKQILTVEEANEARMLQLEVALAEVLRNQSGEVQVSLVN